MTDQYRFGYQADLLEKFPTVVAGAALSLGADRRAHQDPLESLRLLTQHAHKTVTPASE